MDDPPDPGFDPDDTEPAPHTILISDSPGEIRWALLDGDVDEDARVLEIVHQRTHLPDVGAILAGRIRSAVPGHDAVFVDINHGAPGFLAAEDSPGGLPPEGRLIPVQVIREGVEEKGPKLTAACTLPGRLIVYTPTRAGIGLSPRAGSPAQRDRLRSLLADLLVAGEGVIARTAATDAPRPAIQAELSDLRARWRLVQAAVTEARTAGVVLAAPPPLDGWMNGPARIGCILTNTADQLLWVRHHLRIHHPDWAGETRLEQGDLFETAGVSAVLDIALAPRVRLPGGGSLIIDETPALTAIDVDAGAGSPQAIAWAAVPEIARQIRLRGLAGQIVIDFPRERRGPDDSLVRALAAALADDPLGARVLGPTRGGLVEIVRPRRRSPLSHILLAPRMPRSLSLESEVLEALRAAIRATQSAPGRWPVLRAGPEALALLDGPLAPAVRETERRLGHPLQILPWPPATDSSRPAAGAPAIRLDQA